MKIRITVDPDLCIGAASCVTVAPDAFVMNAENKAEVLDHGAAPGGSSYRREIEIDPSELENLVTSAQSCPTLAITIENLETGEQVYPA